MVNAPAVMVKTHPGGLDYLGDLLRKAGIASSGVLHREELIGEPIEVVDPS